MSLFNQQPQTVADNSTFIRLIQVTRDDPELRQRLMKILALDSFNRHESIQSILDVMMTTGAPEELVSALALLLDDEVAETALVLIQAG
jgi:hypothetical protein